ncbi:hypothetical protein [Micromonospora arborensis]|uniref:hypothetical protein n=1 Tax=Micromonospora arborensis TaxID=2116518 RepID=UPI00371836CF
MSVQTAPRVAAPSAPVLGASDVEVHAVTKKYGDKVALDAVGFTVPAGTITGFVGDSERTSRLWIATTACGTSHQGTGRSRQQAPPTHRRRRQHTLTSSPFGGKDPSPTNHSRTTMGSASAGSADPAVSAAA